jgi:hypothetical protein
MHVLGQSADERFVYFNRAVAAHLFDRPVFERQPYTMQQEPRRLLSNAKGAMKFITTDGVFGVDFKPHGHQPLIQAKGRVLEHCSDLGAELLFRVFVLTLPAALIGQIVNFGRSAMRTLDAIRPADLNEEILRRVRVSKIPDGFD